MLAVSRVYAVLAARCAGQATVKVDYVAVLNQPILAVPD
jgi:hypothetical protein